VRHHNGDSASTYFADCWRLPPAHILCVRPAGLHLQRYWTLESHQEIRLAADDAYVEALRDLLRQAVHDRIRSVVPVGAHVTGGLDSSAVTCLAAVRLRQAKQGLQGHTWSPPITATDNPEEGEVPFITAVCRQAGLTLSAPTVTPEEMRDTITLRLGPGGVIPLPASELAMHALMHAQGTRVVLSGWGGDEMASFNGRGYWAALAQQGRWPHVWRELVWWQQRRGGWLPALFLSKMLYPLLPDAIWWPYRRWRGRRPADHPLRWSCIQPTLAHRLQLDARLRATALRERPGVRTNQYQLVMHGHLAARMEAWSADAAQWGLDYRYPLLDRRLLEWCLALPPAQYVRQGWSRYLFRRALDGLVPPCLPWQRDKNDPVSERKGNERRHALWPLLREPLALYARHPHVHNYVDVPRMQAQLARLIADTTPLSPTPQPLGFARALTTAAFVHRYGGG
jgi:asparagine synthase (glutamine-hydrolysing)